MQKKGNETKQWKEIAANMKAVCNEIKKVDSSVSKLIGETRATNECLGSVESKLKEKGGSRTWGRIISIIALCVSAAALIISCNSFSLQKANYAAIVDFDEKVMSLEDNPLLFHFSISQGNIAHGYYAIIIDDNIEYRSVELQGWKENEFTVNLDEMRDEYNKNKQIQFALVLYDNNGTATIRYYSRLHLDELEGTYIKTELRDNEAGEIVISEEHNWSDNLVQIDCTLCNEYTIHKILEKEKMRTYIRVGEDEIFMRHLSAEKIYSFIEKIRADAVWRN